MTGARLIGVPTHYRRNITLLIWHETNEQPKDEVLRSNDFLKRRSACAIIVSRWNIDFGLIRRDEREARTVGIT